MSLFPLIASLLGGPEAEAKQFYASKTGKTPEEIPLNLKKSFSEAFPVATDSNAKPTPTPYPEPKNPEEFNKLAKEMYEARLSNKNITNKSVGEIMNDVDLELTKAALGQMGVKSLQDIPSVVLGKLGISPDEQKQFNQIFIEQPKNVSGVGGIGFIPSVSSKSIPIQTGIEGIQTSELNPQTYSTLGILELGKYSEGKNFPRDLARPVAKVPYYPDRPEDTAAQLVHELLHNVNFYRHPEKFSGRQIPQDIEKDPENFIVDRSYENAMDKLNFLKHFGSAEKDSKLNYGLHDALLRMVHPEWFKKEQMPTPSPTPEPSLSSPPEIPSSRSKRLD